GANVGCHRGLILRQERVAQECEVARRHILEDLLAARAQGDVKAEWWVQKMLDAIGTIDTRRGFPETGNDHRFLEVDGRYEGDDPDRRGPCGEQIVRMEDMLARRTFHVGASDRA